MSDPAPRNAGRGVPAAFLGAPAAEAAEGGEARLAIGQREQALLLPEVAAFAERVSAPALREAYAALRDAVEAGAVSGPDLKTLEDFLAMGLQTSRFRHQHGPEAAVMLNRLYAKTPRGAADAAAAEGVNKALGELVGQELGAISIRATTPGSYELVVETEACQMTVGISPDGLRIVSVEAGL